MTTHHTAADDEHRRPVEAAITLTKRQRQVLALVAEGATDGEMALRLGISVETVAWHVREIRAQLKARTRAHAVALVLREGLPLELQSRDGQP